MPTDLKTLLAEKAKLDAQIAALQKLQACPVSHKTAAKYFDLQAAYVAACKQK